MEIAQTLKTDIPCDIYDYLTLCNKRFKLDWIF